jgi:spore coat protein U domain-containing protein, fimbrial subunit CupE1/2/3/6
VFDSLRICTSRSVALLAATVGLFSSGSAFAGTATTTMGVSMTITAGCSASATPVGFGTASVLSSAITANGGISVTCTNTTPYNVGLDQGAGSGATVAGRLMTGPSSATVSYGLFQDSAMSKNWGKTVGTDTVPGTGSGSAQSLLVYGKVPAQTSAAPGSYADVVNVTVSY